MLTGELSGKSDAARRNFWTGRDSDPLEVIEQTTYTFFSFDGAHRSVHQRMVLDDLCYFVVGLTPANPTRRVAE